MKKTIQGIGVALVILLMAVATFTFLAPRFGWSVDTVYSGSMEPQLKVGGVVVTRPVAAEEIRVGDIITFHSPLNDELTSHRVVAVEDGVVAVEDGEVAIEDGSPLQFQTKGDANAHVDPFVVPAQNLAGEVCFHMPYLGYAAQFIKSPLGLILTLCLPGLAIIVMEVVKVFRAIKEERSKREYGM